MTGTSSPAIIAFHRNTKIHLRHKHPISNISGAYSTPSQHTNTHARSHAQAQHNTADEWTDRVASTFALALPARAFISRTSHGRLRVYMPVQVGRVRVHMSVQVQCCSACMRVHSWGGLGVLEQWCGLAGHACARRALHRHQHQRSKTLYALRLHTTPAQYVCISLVRMHTCANAHMRE